MYANTPGRTVRTHAVAERGLGTRIVRSIHRGPWARTNAARAAVIMLFPVIAFVIHPDRTGAIDIVVPAVMLGLVAALLLLIISLGWRYKFRRGTEMSAEFTPTSISYQIGKLQRTVELANIITVRSDANCLQMRVRTSFGTALAVIPNELVPPSLADYVVRMRG